MIVWTDSWLCRGRSVGNLDREFPVLSLRACRAIGDWCFKDQTNLPAVEQKVIALPDIHSCTANRGDTLLIVCDGLVEAQTNADVCRSVRESKNQNDPADIAFHMIRQSLASGSNDNHTAVVVQFADGNGYGPPSEFRPGPFVQYQGDRKFAQAYLDDAARHGYSGKVLTEMVKDIHEENSGDQKMGGMGGPVISLPMSGKDGQTVQVPLQGNMLEQLMMMARQQQLGPDDEESSGDEETSQSESDGGSAAAAAAVAALSRDGPDIIGPAPPGSADQEFGSHPEVSAPATGQDGADGAAKKKKKKKRKKKKRKKGAAGATETSAASS